MFPDAEPKGGGAYRVLARKYRPSSFAEMVGQDALIRTLSNAIKSGRLAHAFMLTGVRGVGKTTTARIMARALNCIGADGTGGPTISPCGGCDNCRAIAGDRHVDVIEMDAASHTGVEDIREIIEGVRYAPVSARYKIYIIDEVHMLSKNAFNALLKTLEEPPPHVKFIFATTEIRKVPITVLSRCQRFDLRRIDGPVLAAHFGRICEKEGIAAEAEALALIARAADGSARDGLSLLDQAIALGDGGVRGEQVREMLGLADRTRILDLFAAAVTGETAAALEGLDDLHRVGADPLVVMQDLLEYCHFLTRLKAAPETAITAGTPEAERLRGAELAAKLTIPALTRAWQILLKGLEEVQRAPHAQAAAEMVVIRLAHAAGLPTPGDLVAKLANGGFAPAGGGGVPAGGGPGGRGGAPVALAAMAGGLSVRPAPSAQVAAAPLQAAAAAVAAMPPDFKALVQLFADRKEGVLYAQLHGGAHLVHFEPGRLEIRLKPNTPNIAGRVGALLSDWTGTRWVVSVSNQPGEPTLQEQAHAAVARAHAEAAQHPVVKAVLDAFPGAMIKEVVDAAAEAEAAAGESGESVPDAMPWTDEEGDFE
ncbi:MAG TPA: DNA polymerase III subunit gamma/tau [Alphaproteobacteria bacterium]|nr:DNA polymerase III subunit gamma/tau [Alphaproteobacteria bacterium]